MKQSGFGFDGILIPDIQEQYIYFIYVQFPEDTTFYSRFFSDIFLYLYQNEEFRNWRGITIHPNRTIGVADSLRYIELLNSSRVKRIYLDELEKVEDFALGILILLISPPDNIPQKGRELIDRIKLERTRESAELLELIKTILVYKLPQLSRQEIEAMFSINELKQTRVYQEALEEGREEGIQTGKLQAKMNSVPRLLSLGLTPEQISAALDLDIERVRGIIAELRG